MLPNIQLLLVLLNVLVSNAVGLLQGDLVGVCGDFDGWKQNEGIFNIDSDFDPSFSTAPPLRRYRGVHVIEPQLVQGQICPNNLSGFVTEGSSEEFHFPFCDLFINGEDFARPNSEGQLLTTGGGSIIALTISNYLPNGEFSHIRFWLAHDRNTTGTFILTWIGVDSAGELATEDLIELDILPPNASECPGLGRWRQFDLPLGTAQEFLDNRSETATTTEFQFRIFYDTFPNFDPTAQRFAITNYEYVNLDGNGTRIPPSPANNRILEYGLFENITCDGVDDLLRVDDIAITSLTVIILCLVFYCYILLREKQGVVLRTATTVTDVLWFFLSFVIICLAIAELSDFQQKLNVLDACAEQANNAWNEAPNRINKQELRRFFDFENSKLFGRVSLVLPPYQIGDIEKLISFDVASDDALSEALLVEVCDNNSSTINCTTTDPEEFFTRFDSSIEQGVDGLYKLEGLITVSQDHWIPLVIVSFILDAIFSVLLFALRMIRRNMSTVDPNRNLVKSISLVAILSSFGLTCYVLAIAITEPVRYNTAFLLTRSVGFGLGNEFNFEFGILAQPKLVASGYDLSLDLRDVDFIERSFENDVFLRFTHLSTYQDVAVTELSPTGLLTHELSCPLNEVVDVVNTSASIFEYSIDCTNSPRLVPLIPALASEERQVFLLSNIFIALVLVDILISLTDFAALSVHSRHKRRTFESLVTKPQKV